MKLCVIPARGGSKRIPKKNIRLFCGKPIIQWSIEAALKSKCFDKVISQGVYIVPLDNYNYLVGSTYNHKDLTDGPTAQGKASLKDKLSDILSVGYEVVSCVSGIRPTVKDRKPLVGLHPTHSKIAVFNGLGTRGALQGPYLSDNFSKFLTTQSKNTQNAENQRITSFFDGKKSQFNG